MTRAEKGRRWSVVRYLLVPLMPRDGAGDTEWHQAVPTRRAEAAGTVVKSGLTKADAERTAGELNLAWEVMAT